MNQEWKNIINVDSVKKLMISYMTQQHDIISKILLVCQKMIETNSFRINEYNMISKTIDKCRKTALDGLLEACNGEYKQEILDSGNHSMHDFIDITRTIYSLIHITNNQNSANEGKNSYSRHSNSKYMKARNVKESQNQITQLTFPISNPDSELVAQEKPTFNLLQKSEQGVSFEKVDIVPEGNRFQIPSSNSVNLKTRGNYSRHPSYNYSPLNSNIVNFVKSEYPDNIQDKSKEIESSVVISNSTNPQIPNQLSHNRNEISKVDHDFFHNISQKSGIKENKVSPRVRFAETFKSESNDPIEEFNTFQGKDPVSKPINYYLEMEKEQLNIPQISNRLPVPLDGTHSYEIIGPKGEVYVLKPAKNKSKNTTDEPETKENQVNKSKNENEVIPKLVNEKDSFDSEEDEAASATLKKKSSNNLDLLKKLMSRGSENTSQKDSQNDSGEISPQKVSLRRKGMIEGMERLQRANTNSSGEMSQDPTLKMRKHRDSIAALVPVSFAIVEQGKELKRREEEKKRNSASGVIGGIDFGEIKKEKSSGKVTDIIEGFSKKVINEENLNLTDMDFTDLSKTPFGYLVKPIFSSTSFGFENNPKCDFTFENKSGKFIVCADDEEVEGVYEDGEFKIKTRRISRNPKIFCKIIGQKLIYQYKESFDLEMIDLVTRQLTSRIRGSLQKEFSSSN